MTMSKDDQMGFGLASVQILWWKYRLQTIQASSRHALCSAQTSAGMLSGMAGRLQREINAAEEAIKKLHAMEETLYQFRRVLFRDLGMELEDLLGETTVARAIREDQPSMLGEWS